MKKLIKSPILIGIIIFAMAIGYVLHVNAAYNFGAWLMSFNTPTSHTNPIDKEDAETIQVALLLDTSNSMDGLIEQAKSQLWKIVSELNHTEQNGRIPDLEIAIYEYGNDNLSALTGYIRQVSPFTKEMDDISEKLFALTTNGGSEYCGHVIKTSLNQLAWRDNPNDLRLIYIAGNEGFNQGLISYKGVCKQAKNQDIIVNTIFCGNEEEGINSFWKDGATLANGNYMSMNQNKETVYTESPYDQEIERLNEALNDSYVPYGKDGAKYKAKQKMQDDNAEKYGKVNKVERATFKSSKNYSNEKWDLIDAYKKDKAVIKKKKAELPAKYQNKTDKEIETALEQDLENRKKIKAEIKELSDKRRDYVKQVEATKKDKSSLESSIIKSLKKQAKSKGYKVKE